MVIVVSLRDIVDELQMLSHERNAYLKKSTGKVITMSEDDFEMVRSMEALDASVIFEKEESDHGSSDYSVLEKEFFRDVKNVLVRDHDYLKLPSKFELDEYKIMETFCLSAPTVQISTTLLHAIRGAGAFRRFKETIYRFGLEEAWFKFKDMAYKELALAWLEDHGFAYTDDMNRRQQNL